MLSWLRRLHLFLRRKTTARIEALLTPGCCVLVLLTLAACAPLPPQREYLWQPSPNYDQRRPNFVILHGTSDRTVDAALATLTNPERKVSAHYLIGRDGTVIQLVDETARAWHAGKSWWGGSTDLNSASIGIELDNAGDEPFAEAQIVALLALLEELRTRYRIPSANFIGHGDVAPGRKVDPSRFFPWQRLAQHGFGLWCEAQPLPSLPPGFDPMPGLMAYGYDIARPASAIQAFRRHFLGSDTDGELTSDEQALLFCLLQMKILRDIGER
jgi:N-acetylmuramoyl-L-alanine amidase